MNYRAVLAATTLLVVAGCDQRMPTEPAPSPVSPLQPNIAASATDLFFSEYIEGTSNNKALEIFNPTGAPVDLAAGDYNVQMYFNGSFTVGLAINLTGTVASGDVFVLAHALADPAIRAQADQVNGEGWFNGDDAVVLLRGNTVLDVIGQIGFDPGMEWGAGLHSTMDNTLRRRATVCEGDDNGSDPFVPAFEWDGFETNNSAGLGSHIAVCVVGPPATLVLEPTADANTVDSEHCVTATVRDAFGNPVPGVTVRFTVMGSVNTSGSATTDANGQAEFCYDGPPLPGADVIHAFADTDNDEMEDLGEPFGDATKTWILPVTTPLCEINISNGGRITALNGDKATFGGNAKSDADGNTMGQEEYHDHGPAQPMNVHSINILAIVCGAPAQETILGDEAPGQEAAIYGEATVNGEGRFFFRIRVVDNGEPGTGRDMYGILVANGYYSGEQLLEGGNVQIRREDSPIVR